MGFEQLTAVPRPRPAVATQVRCAVTAGPARWAQVAASVSGPIHIAHDHPPGGPDILLLTRDTAGLTEGDTCCSEVSVEKGASIVIADTGPTNLLPSNDGRTSSQSTELSLAPGARAVFLPHAVVPFRQSRCLSSTRVQLSPSATAVVGSVLSPGRVARGERWAPALYDQRVEIRVDDELIACDAQRVSPSCSQGAGHVVSLFAYSQGVVAALDGVRLAAGEGSGVSAVTDDLIVLRAIVDSCSDGYALLRDATAALLPDLVDWEWSRIGYDR